MSINSDKEVYKRIVKAFSVNAIKEIFNLVDYKERQSELLIRVVNTYTFDMINTAVFDNFSLLKQHVYVYNYAGVLPANYLIDHPYLKSSQIVNANHTVYNLLYPAKFDFFNKSTNALESIDS